MIKVSRRDQLKTKKEGDKAAAGKSQATKRKQKGVQSSLIREEDEESKRKAMEGHDFTLAIAYEESRAQKLRGAVNDLDGHIVYDSTMPDVNFTDSIDAIKQQEYEKDQ
jgi:hypothetical protein